MNFGIIGKTLQRSTLMPSAKARVLIHDDKTSELEELALV
jgi:hypothetical protein